MRIKRLYIGNMGIYRNALMENISSKIVVIGGLNRSGKTTFLETLRHMPFGFSKNLRASDIEYYVESDLEDDSGEITTLCVSGLKEPNISVKDLYGDIDKYTYSQLYTITLDELRKSNVKGDEEKLQAVLLGAGLKDIVHIPKIVEGFKKEKEKIGGKLGSPKTKMFKSYYDRILEGLEKREEALKQLEEYEIKVKELKELDFKIDDYEKDSHKLKQDIIVLETAKSYYNQYVEKSDAKIILESIDQNIINRYANYPSLERVETLKEEWQEAYEKYCKAKDEFNKNVSEDSQYYNKLLSLKGNIKDLYKDLSGLRERLDNFNSQRTNYERSKVNIILKMNSINEKWEGDFKKVLNINCDSIEQDKLMSIVEELRNLENRKEQTKWELEEIKSQKKIIQENDKKIRSVDSDIFIKKYLYISLSVFFAGALLFVFNKTIGGSLALIGCIAALICMFTKNPNFNSDIIRKKELALQLETTLNKEKISEEKLDILNKKIMDLEEKLKYYKILLNLEDNISSLGLVQYFKDVQDIKRQILLLANEERSLSNLKANLEINLYRIGNIIGYSFQENKDIIKETLILIDRIEAAAQELKFAEELSHYDNTLSALQYKTNNALFLSEEREILLDSLDKIIKDYRTYNYYRDLKQKIELIDRQVMHVLNNKSIKNALIDTCKNYGLNYEDTLNAFENIYNLYGSFEEIDRNYINYSEMLNLKIKAIEELKEERQILKTEIKNLAISQKIEASQRIIDEGRAELKSLAVKFSVFSAAEYILECVQGNFINNTKDSILKGAGEIFKKITNEQYKAILPGDNLLQTDYKALINNGELCDSADMLSRGTGEQLYLSVRINRIKDMSPKLPLILDDPFVNFDSIHTKNTLEIIAELAEENQVFILTCHAEMIKLLSDIREDTQYWHLDKGKLTLTDSKELIKKLSI